MGDPVVRFPYGNFFYFFEGSKFMEVRFDAQRATFTEPNEVQFRDWFRGNA